ncbi:hypothetical protein SKAU_G00007040 [Synaphobranchus kaupii]|uniref:Uncharacterized protein n=1 Tax=Synaphobranchus kaupii TaxID=118154 RepID=A0A9Q1GAH4_SYNKA|nr:hypothetical protein SKAU_G00007040 [Synaphobranchus kaupii]
MGYIFTSLQILPCGNYNTLGSGSKTRQLKSETGNLIPQHRGFSRHQKANKVINGTAIGVWSTHKTSLRVQVQESSLN